MFFETPPAPVNGGMQTHVFGHHWGRPLLGGRPYVRGFEPEPTECSPKALTAAPPNIWWDVTLDFTIHMAWK